MSGESLAMLQREFLSGIRGAGSGGLPGAIAHGRLSGQTGFGIYAHAYSARLREALENDHPVLGSYLGDELWSKLCEGYIAAHPSRVRSLRDFGAHLPSYLEQTAPFDAHPVIAELAAFERRCWTASTRPTTPAPNGKSCSDWRRRSGRSLRVRFHPSLRLHPVSWNSVEIWRALKADAAPPAAGAATGAAWALWRDEERVTRFRSLDARECAALTSMQRGGSFGDLCQLLLAWLPGDEIPAVALGYLRSWCAEGWLSRLHPACERLHAHGCIPADS